MGVRNEILDYIRAVPHSPTVREIGAHVDRSVSTVFYHLDALEKEGLVVRYGVERRIYSAERVPPKSPGRLPLVGSRSPDTRPGGPQ